MNFLETAKRIQSLAQAGLTYSENTYDLERYEELWDISMNMISALSDEEKVEIQKLYSKSKEYPTPKVDVRAVVFRNNKILLVKEKVDGRWSMPGGWADIGYSPSEVAVKETWEEAGLKVQTKRIIAALDKRCHPHPPSLFYSYKLMYLCEMLDDSDPQPGNETLDAGFFGREAIPELSFERTLESHIELAYEFLDDDKKETVFD